MSVNLFTIPNKQHQIKRTSVYNNNNLMFIFVNVSRFTFVT